MIAEPAPPVHTEAMPTDLVRLTVVARRGPMSLATLHRWRLRRDDPLPTWRLGGTWYVSEAELAEWITRRSGRGPAAPQASPVTTARRKREIEAAVKKCVEMGC